MLYPSDSVLLLDFLSRVWISRKGIVKCDVFGPISYVRWRDEHLAVGFSSITKTCLCSGQAATARLNLMYKLAQIYSVGL